MRRITGIIAAYYAVNMPTYIHERADWPRFRWDSAALAPRLASVRHRQGRLIGRMEELGFPLQNQATLASLTEDVVTTSAIEGETLDRQQVRSSLARRLGIDIGALAKADRHIDRIVEVMLDATQNYGKKLTAERLYGWHAALFPTGRSGITRITVGGWRRDKAGPMQVVSGRPGKERVHFQAPAAARLPAEMKAFLAWFNGDSEIDPVLKAGLAHLWFVTVHPFDDGNGRIARAIADLALARSEKSPQRFYSMSAQIREERSAYYAILEATQKSDLDVTRWLAWFLDCLGRAFEGAETILASVLGKVRFWRKHAAAGLNERQQKMLNRLFDGFEGKLTSSKWAKIAKCSPDTALRDIADLVARGILAKDAAGGRSTRYSLAAGT